MTARTREWRDAIAGGCLIAAAFWLACQFT